MLEITLMRKLKFGSFSKKTFFRKIALFYNINILSYKNSKNIL
jgi:hypothetical protein